MTTAISTEDTPPANGAGSTDWAAMREDREDHRLSAPDETGPARIMALLAELGIACREEKGLVLLTPDGPSLSFIALVSATELFAWDEAQDERLARRRASRVPGAGDLFSTKVALWRHGCTRLAGPNAYLYVVDLDNWLADGTNQAVAQMTEHDDRVVRKFICGPGELAKLLANPFGPAYTGDHRPQFEVHRRDQALYDKPVPDFATTVTHRFEPVADSDRWLRQLQQHPDAARLLGLANNLARRVMGADYQLSAAGDDVLLTRCGKFSSIPWHCMGNGEQYGLAFCAFLALAADDVTPDTWIGVSEALNYLDLSRFLLAVDVLRDFVVATGANVYFRTNKSSYLELVKAKLETAGKHLKALST
jgi:hypothetical protein